MATMLPNAVESTRVFVSGLPSSLSTDQLASHFGKQYSVTDAHVFPDRRIGFVGFRTAETAQNAVKYFNRSYIRMSKISVEIARPVEVKHGSSGQAVPVSQRDFTKGSKQRVQSSQNLSCGTDNIDSLIPDTGESLKRKRTMADDGEGARAEINGNTEVGQDREGGIRRKDESRAEKEAQISEDGGEESTAQIPSDSDWLRGRTSRLLDLVGPADGPIANVPNLEKDRPQSSSEDDTEPAEIRDHSAANTGGVGQQVPNARLFVRNLAFDITEEDLRSRFGEFGKVQEVHLVKDVRKSISKGMAFIQFSEVDNAQLALQGMDGVAFHGRLLHILPASDKREQKLTEFEISKLPLKKQKALRRKLEAGTASFSWNSLYMNPDAVMSSIAQRLGVAKSDILDPTSADAAVKQAHAETQVIKETKDYFRAHGVNVDALKATKRDDRSLLLKNFPFGTSEGELRGLLEPFGGISKFMLPPAGTMAIVQFDESYSAAKALRNLAYKNIKGSVLYLEKAPQGLITDVAARSDNQSVPEISSAKEQAQVSSGNTATVFVRNLNFSTTSSRLVEVFTPLTGFLSARVKTRTDAKRPRDVLSMGFGFVEFRTKSHADAAVAAMNGYRLDGHELLVKLSTKNTDLAEERRKNDHEKKHDGNRTKILIKNLPFQASRKDVRSLFAQYGELKTVRVPKKFDNSSRGFGFAEFVTAKEAENAMEALSDTHLLGRRLVLDFAQEETVDPEEEISALERKMEQQSNRFNTSKLANTNRKRFVIGLGKEELI